MKAKATIKKADPNANAGVIKLEAAEVPASSTVAVRTLTIGSGSSAQTVKVLATSDISVSGSGDGSGITGTVEFVADNDWYVNGSTHQLRKRLRILDLATGQVTDKPNTTYANGWEVLCDTTPISSIINQS